MLSKEELMAVVKKADRKQVFSMIYDFEMIGFYREDKRQQKQFILDCINNCYTTDINMYGIHDNDSMRMEEAVLNAVP